MAPVVVAIVLAYTALRRPDPEARPEQVGRRPTDAVEEAAA